MELRFRDVLQAQLLGFCILKWIIFSKEIEENTIYLLNMSLLGTKMSGAYWNAYGQFNMFLKQAPKSL